MKNGLVLLTLGALVVTGCQNKGLEGSADLVAAAAYCPQIASSDENLQISGQSEVKAGNLVNYTLEQNGNCVSSSDVAWKAAGASRSSSSSSGLVSVFQRSGSYVITARKTNSTGVQSMSTVTTVVKEDIKLVGPQAGYTFNPLEFVIVAPEDRQFISILWNFGEGASDDAGGKNVSHAFFSEGEYLVTAKVTDIEGAVTKVQLRVTIMPMLDGVDCLSDLRISGADEAKINVATNMYVFIPACLTNHVGSVRWNFGDGNTGNAQNINHTYTAVGSYPVTATLYLVDSQEPWVTLDHKVNVIKDLEIEPEPEEPEVPGKCKISGETRSSQGDLYSEEVVCGIDGKKTVTYRDTVVEECKLVIEELNWVETSRTKEITHEGLCQGQSCKLSDGSLLLDGMSKVFYSSSTPSGTCESVSETRTCSNGVLTGSTASSQLTCDNGCGDFGSHGTVKTDVVTGEVQVALQCRFQEEGFVDIFNQMSDQICKDGQVINTNTRQGSLKVAGSCPVYSYSPSDRWSACSANCGGEQTRIFQCVDDKGVKVDDLRCADQVVPAESRLCDANPEAVRREEVSSAVEEASGSISCPSNQIGVIMNKREVITTKIYACIQHSVQLESETAVPGAWVEEKYCRDYVPRRCSQDSISNSEALGRYKWMVKCQNELPVVKEFLATFADVSAMVGKTEVQVGGTGRHLYPTFMDRAYSPEKPWIAPKRENADCTMPTTAYVAAVCVSSCATPEQQLIVEDVVSKKMKYVPFVQALTQKLEHIGTLKNTNSMSSKAIAKAKVDQWVTELIDTEHEILVFKMKSGKELRLTKNHPVLTKEGMMKEAKEFVVGEELVQLGGALDPIKSIDQIKHFGKVYNVFVQSSEPQKNIVITNGYLNGTAYFQNEGTKDMNRQLFRRNLTEGVFGK